MTGPSPTAVPAEADDLADLARPGDTRGAQRTAAEIAQQPQLWRQVLEAAVARHDNSERFLRPLFERPDLRVVLAGAGTSAFAGQVLAPALARELERRVDAVPTTDIVSNPRQHFAYDVPTLLVSFARSGDSPESLAATALAAECLGDVHHLIVTCNPHGTLARTHTDLGRSLVLTMPPDANDQGFAMTSSFTCMVLAVWLTLRSGRPDEATVHRLMAAGDQAINRGQPAARALAARGYDRIVYLGSGSFTGLARESALKLLELTAGAVNTYADSPLAFRHGPKAVLTTRTLVLVYVSNDPYTRRYDEDMIAELRGALGDDNVVAITADAGERLEHATPWHVDDEVLLAMPFAIYAQLVGLHFSLALGKTPDNPFPAGEVNRVVQGVNVYPLTGG